MKDTMKRFKKESDKDLLFMISMLLFILAVVIFIVWLHEIRSDECHKLGGTYKVVDQIGKTQIYGCVK